MKNKIQIKGQFWFPELPENKLHGKLLIEEGKSIILEIYISDIQDYNEFMAEYATDSTQIVKMAGISCDNRYITLLNNIIIPPYNDETCNAWKIIYISVDYVVCGRELYNKEMLIEYFRFSIDNLYDWLELKSEGESKREIIKDLHIDNLDKEEKTTKKFTLSIIYDDGSSGGSDLYHKDKLYIELTSDQAISIKDFRQLAFQIQLFFCFAMNNLVDIFSVKISRQIKNIKQKEISDYYYKGYNHSGKDKSLCGKIFNFKYIASDFGITLNKWLRLYKDSYPALNLYLSSKTDAYKFIETKLLILGQALEVYHRINFKISKLIEKGNLKQLQKECGKVFLKKLNEYSIDIPKEKEQIIKNNIERMLNGLNETTLRDRLRDLIMNEQNKKFFEIKFDEIKREEWIGEIVKARNYLTHWSKPYKSKDGDSNTRNFVKIYDRMDSFFKILLLCVLFQEKAKSIIEANKEILSNLDK